MDTYPTGPAGLSLLRLILEWENARSEKKRWVDFFNVHGALNTLSINSCYIDPGASLAGAGMVLCSSKHFYFLPGHKQNNRRSNPCHWQTWPLKSPPWMTFLTFSFCAAGSKVLQYSKLKQWRSLDPTPYLEGSSPGKSLLTHIWPWQDDVMNFYGGKSLRFGGCFYRSS